jgi:UDPglucose--hexose-1-phosphate uridylyltransferase
VSDFLSRTHRRYNPLTGEWVLVSPGRLSRPWQGESERAAAVERPRYDPQCYLCPGNSRANGERNPQYDRTHVFDNDFPALDVHLPSASAEFAEIMVARSEKGICRVVCFSARHDLDIASMASEEIRGVVDEWAKQYSEFAADPAISAITIFENRGAAMGASNPHPHGQIWANESVPNELRKEDAALRNYAERGACILCSYVEHEIELRERVIYHDADICALVPFWAAWPFEALVLPRSHVPSLPDLNSTQRDALAAAMRLLTARYDRLFQTPFPYSMGFHQRPTDGRAYPHWHVHAHYFPPLLRSATVRKFVVGYELLAQPQRDMSPEDAAERLRNV